MRVLLQTLFFFLLVTPICFGQGSWTKIGDMPEIRAAHTADEINGKVYIAGGANTEQGAYPTTMLVYDRDSSTWTTIPLPINSARLQQTSCVVDSNLYLIGGVILVGGILNSTSEMYMFKPSTGEWILKNPMPTDRNTPACALLDGKIYVAGGLHVINGVPDYNGLKTFEVYDLSTETWSALPDMPTYRWGLSVVAFEGKIYVFGGRGIVDRPAAVDVYNPQDSSWTTVTNIPTPRYQLAACVLDSNIYAIDGWYSSSSGPIYDKVEVYNPLTNQWNIETPMPVAVAMLDGYALDGKIYMYGGSYTTHPNIGTSAIYELSFDDIFALQPYIDKLYARVNIDSVLFRTKFSNINNHPFTPYLIHANSDSTHLDSLTLYDDGLHGDSLTDDGLYGGYISPRQYEDFLILSVSTIDNQTNKYYNTPDRCRFTTAGPVVLDSISYRKSFDRYLVKTFLRNESTNTTITNISVKLICDDPWVSSISPDVVNVPNISPGSVVSNSSLLGVSCIDSLFPDYFNFKVEIMSNGWTYWTESMQVIITGVEDEVIEIPTEFALKQNYPNPFNPTTRIKYSIPQSSKVVIKVFDVLGHEIETLVNEEKPIGTYELIWNAIDLPSGVYFYQLRAGEFVQTKKMILLK